MKKDWFLKIIILEISIKGSLLILLSGGVFSLINKDLGLLSRQLAADMNLDADNRILTFILDKVGMAKTTLLVEISTGLLLYGIICCVQAWGLHKRRPWAEYLTVGLVSIFIPFEVWAVIDHPSLIRLMVLIFNAAIVTYLLKHTELFPARQKEK